MRITYFGSLYDKEASEHEVNWNDLVASIAAPARFSAKVDCPLTKLARFGPERNPKGYFRNNRNVSAITGVELDYDGEQMSLTEAADRFRTVGLECLLYTSANHDPAKPRWRVLIPLGAEYPPDYREAFVERANAVLGGICAPESATLAQAFYVGHVDGKIYECVRVQGEHLDKLSIPEARPIRATIDLDVPQWEKVDLSTLALDPHTLALIKNGPEPGFPRHAALMTVANALAKAQIAPETILRILADRDNLISQKALERRNVSEAMEWLARHTVSTALERFPPLASIFPPLAGRPIDKRKLLHDAKSLVNEPSAPKWLIRGVLEQDCFAVLFGAPESGKSLIALDMAHAIASGAPFHGRQTTQAPVVYISGEGNSGLSRRLRALKIARDDATLPDMSFTLTSRAVHFRDAESMRELVAAIDALPQKPKLIVIDTYMRANAGGDENSAKDASEFVKLCDALKERFRCTTLLIGHTSLANQDRLMGSAVIRGAADVEMGFKRLDQEKPKNVSVLKCTKMKDTERFEDIYFQLTPQKLAWFDPETHEQITSWTFTELDPPDALNKAPTHILFAQCLGSKPIAYDKVRSAFMRLCVAPSAKARQKTWDRALDKALTREWCKRVNDDLIPSPPAMYRDGIDLAKEVAG